MPEVGPRVREVFAQLLMHGRIDDFTGFDIDEAIAHLLQFAGA